MKRKCKKCTLEKSYDEFTKSKVCRDGITHECKKCNNARRQLSGYSRSIRGQQKKTREDNVNSWRKFKATLGCWHCRENAPECLQFHHINQDKDKNINSNRGPENQIEELLKCAVVCANCHCKIHAKTLEEPKPLKEKVISYAWGQSQQNQSLDGQMKVSTRVFTY